MPRRFCPKCGATLEFSVQKFCTSCGATLPEVPAAAPAASAPAGIPVWALAAGAVVVLLVAGVLLLPQIMAVAGGTAAGGAGSGNEITPLPPQPGTSQPGMTSIPTTGITTIVTATPVPPTPPTTIPTTSPTPTPTPTPTTTVPTPTPTPEPTSVITWAVTQVPPQPPAGSSTSSTEGAPYIDPGALEARIHVLTNAQRQNNGLAALSYDSFLADIARGHSWDMVQRNFFEHQNPDGQMARDRGIEAGYPCIRVFGLYTYSGISENLYQGHRASSYYTNAEGDVISYDWRTLEDIAQVTVDGWMASPGHRENILTPHLSYEGIGVAFGPDDKVYVTQNFC